MVAMVVVRQLKWLYNQLKVLTVSWIPYIPINLSPDRPWSKARSNDSNLWCLILFFFPFFSPLKLAFLHGFEVAVQGKKPSSFPDLVFFSTHPSIRATQHKNLWSFPLAPDLLTIQQEAEWLHCIEWCGCCPLAQRRERGISLLETPPTRLCCSPCQAIPRGWWGLEAICWKSHCIPTAWDSELSSSGSLLAQLLPECQEKKRRLKAFYDLLTHESGRNPTVCKSGGIAEGFRGPLLLLLVAGLLVPAGAMWAGGLAAGSSRWLTGVYFVFQALSWAGSSLQRANRCLVFSEGFLYLCHNSRTVEFPFWRLSESPEVSVVPGQQLGQPCPSSPAEFAVRLQHCTKGSSWLLLCFPTFLENLAECRAPL